MSAVLERASEGSRAGLAVPRGRLGEATAAFGLFVLFIGTVLASSELSAPLQLAVVGTALVLTLLVPAGYQIRRGASPVPFLLVPTIISATQNVYLLPIARDVDPSALQIVIILNFVDAVLLLGLLATVRPANGSLPADATAAGIARTIRIVALCAGAISLYGLFTAVVFRADMTSAMASYRNLVTPMLFLLLGLLASRTGRATAYCAGLVVLGVVVVLFGFFELGATDFWQRAGLEDLWAAKGISMASTGLPGNFYSSEQFDDLPVRRMVSSFADPVNFGTFLFAVFVAAWMLRQRLVALLFLAAAAYAVSKGALLGVLIFIALWTRVYANPLVQAIAIAGVVAGAVGFYGFAASNSTGSTDAHLDGFVAAFTELPGHPLGRGMGNVGVLAGLFDGGSDSEVRESGLGVVVSQLGVVGIAVYAVFFVTVIRAASRVADPRLRLGALGLAVAFLANAAFNEVAMSPNSAAPYFVIIGLVIGNAARTTVDYYVKLQI